MPKLKDFKKGINVKQKKITQQWEEVQFDESTVVTTMARRPRHEMKDEEVPIIAESNNVKKEEDVVMNENQDQKVEEVNVDEMKIEEKKPEFRLQFMYSDIVAKRFPKTFKLAEKIVDQWIHDGDFKDLPIDPALVQYAVGKGLAKVKNAEKKLQSEVIPVIEFQTKVLKSYINSKRKKK